MRKLHVRRIFLPIKEAEERSENVNNLESENVSEIVTSAITKLPAKLRVPLILKDIEGFSYQEIADTMQCEMGTVKSRIFRAREGLRKILKPMETELL